MTSILALNDLMVQLHSIESAVTTHMLESVSKLASLTDANYFILVETPEGRKFTGKKYLCDAYLQHQLVPRGLEYEVEFGAAVPSVQLRHVEPSDAMGVSNNVIRRPGQQSRKRPLNQNPISPKKPRLYTNPSDNEVKVEAVMPLDAGVRGANGNGVNGNDITLDDDTPLPSLVSRLDSTQTSENDTFPFSDPSLPLVPLPDESTGYRQSMALDKLPLDPAYVGPGTDQEILNEMIRCPLPLSESLEAKISAISEVCSGPVGENEVAMKIIKSTFYDISKVVAGEFVSLLRSRRLLPHTDPKQFLRARLNVVLAEHSALQTIYETPTIVDFKPWDYSRTNFTCLVKRLLKVKRAIPEEIEQALVRENFAS